MKKFVSLFMVFCVLCALTVTAFAENEPETVTDTVTAEADDKNIIVNITVPPVVAPEVPSDTPEAVVDLDTAEASDAYFVYDLTPREDDADIPSGNGDYKPLPVVLGALFGKYQPRVQTVTAYLSDGSSVSYQEYVPGLAGLDFDWLASVFLFAVALFCMFRIVGGLFKCL